MSKFPLVLSPSQFDAVYLPFFYKKSGGISHTMAWDQAKRLGYSTFIWANIP